MGNSELKIVGLERCAKPVNSISSRAFGGKILLAERGRSSTIPRAPIYKSREPLNMSDEQETQANIPGSPVPPSPVPAQPGTAAQCCEQMDPQTAGKCKLCGKNNICKNCRGLINGKSVCRACKDQILAELDAEKADPSHLPLALVAGAVAAFVSGVVWAAIAVIARVHIGYVAIGVGYLAGQGVFFGSGKKRGVTLQYAAIGCALLGLFLGKLFTEVGLDVEMYPTVFFLHG